MKKCGYLIGVLFFSREVAHREHLKTKSYAVHKTLDSFYHKVIDRADDIIEAYQGQYGIVDIPYVDVKMKSNIIENLEIILAIVEEIRYEAVPKEDTAIQNIIDEVVGQYVETLYLLTLQ